LWSAGGCHHLTCCGLLLALTPATERRHEGDTWCGEGGREHPSCCRFWCPLHLPFLHLLRGVAAAPVVGRVDLVALCQLAVAAHWCGRRVPFFRTLLVQVADPVPQTTGRLPAVDPDVPKLLAVMALRKASLSPIGLHTNGDVAKAGQLENLLGLPRPGQGY
jgi:hypothetical protein